MSAQNQINIVGISGSIRKQSFNTALLGSFANVRQDVHVTIADLTSIPFFNEDHEIPYPQSVVELKNLILAADGIVISTPEYNGMISGVLKNALEWLSRPQLGAPLAGKPVGIVGASTGAFGASSAQVQMRQLAFTLNMHVLNRPVLRLANAGQKFDESGILHDEVTKDAIQQYMNSFVDWIRLLAGSGQPVACR